MWTKAYALLKYLRHRLTLKDVRGYREINSAGGFQGKKRSERLRAGWSYLMASLDRRKPMRDKEM